MTRFQAASKYVATTYHTINAVAFVTYKEWMAYRSHVLVSLFVGPVYFITQYFIWKAVYSSGGPASGDLASGGLIRGFTFEQMLLYYGIATVINYVTYDSAGWNLQMLIRTGRFLTFMLRPVSHRLFAFSQKIGHRILGLLLECIPMYVIFWFVLKIKLIPARPFWTMLSLFFSFTIIFLFNYCTGISAFWLTKTEGVRRMLMIMRDLFAGVFLPLSFFPEVLQQVFFFLPFQFMTYVPIRVFLGSYELAGMTFTIPQIVGIQAIAVIVMLGISELLWRLGISRFTGVGA